MIQEYDVAPVTGSIEYAADVNPHVETGPETIPGVAGFLTTESVEVLLVSHEVVADTVTLSGANDTETDTFIEVVPCPESITIPFTPDGTVHV
jgi:hypothetical protein